MVFNNFFSFMQALRACDFFTNDNHTGSYFMEVMPIFSTLLPSEKRVSPAHWHGDNLNMIPCRVNMTYLEFSTDCK